MSDPLTVAASVTPFHSASHNDATNPLLLAFAQLSMGPLVDTSVTLLGVRQFASGCD